MIINLKGCFIVIFVVFKTWECSNTLALSAVMGNKDVICSRPATSKERAVTWEGAH